MSRVLHINRDDIRGGAARSVSRLHRALLDCGVQDRILVNRKHSTDKTVLDPDGWMDCFAIRCAGKIDHYTRKFLASRKGGFRPAIGSGNLIRRIRREKPDIVHLHNVARVILRIESLPRIGLPMVWTLHDFWTMTGGCSFPGDCEKYREKCGGCPAMNSPREDDLSRKVWSRKRRAWSGPFFNLVSPSRYLAEQAASSTLLADKPITVIPNGLDLNEYRPVDAAEARSRIGLSPDRPIILFGADRSTQDQRKGYRYLLEAMDRLRASKWKKDVELVIFGSGPEGVSIPGGYSTNFVGYIYDDKTLVDLYCAADVYVLPTMEDNLPNTILESLACGTPCVAFNVGGVPEMVDHMRNGYLAFPCDSEDLSKGIAWVLADEERRRGLGEAARKKVLREFNIVDVASRYLCLYEELLEGRKAWS